MAAKTGNMGGALLLGGILVGGYMLAKHQGFSLMKMFRHVQQVAAPELRLALKGIHSETDGTINADIEALNPTSFPFQVKSILGDIFVQGQNVGTVKMFGDTVIRPNDDALIPVAVRVRPAAAVIFRHKGLPVQFRGTINLNNNVLPLTMNYKL